MKKIFIYLLVAGILTGHSASLAQSNTNLICNGTYIDSNAIVQDNTTLVPLRAVCESLGSTVSWDNENNSACVNIGGKDVNFQIGNTNITTSSGTVCTDTPPVIIGDQTFVSLDKLSELLGCDIESNDDSVIIEKPDNNTDNTPETDSGDTNTPSENNLSVQVLELVNAQRASLGLTALTYNAQLEAVAYSHSRDMAENNYFSHTSLSGLSPFDRLTNAGISYSRAAENIAAGQKTPTEVMNSWMNSDGHRKNILNPELKEIGVGIYEGGSYGIYWTQLFITK